MVWTSSPVHKVSCLLSSWCHNFFHLTITFICDRQNLASEFPTDGKGLERISPDKIIISVGYSSRKHVLWTGLVEHKTTSSGDSTAMRVLACFVTNQSHLSHTEALLSNKFILTQACGPQTRMKFTGHKKWILKYVPKTRHGLL